MPHSLVYMGDHRPVNGLMASCLESLESLESLDGICLDPSREIIRSHSPTLCYSIYIYIALLRLWLSLLLRFVSDHTDSPSLLPEMASHPHDDIKQLAEESTSVNPIEKPVLNDTKSPGVARIEALNAHTSLVNRCFIFFGLFLVAYAYGLDGSLRGVYQPYATAGFKTHSTLATIGELMREMKWVRIG